MIGYIVFKYVHHKDEYRINKQQEENRVHTFCSHLYILFMLSFLLLVEIISRLHGIALIIFGNSKPSEIDM